MLLQGDICMFAYMKNGNNYYVYLLTNKTKSTFYVGVTNNLVRRVMEHKLKINDGFTKRYNVTELVYYETYNQVDDAIAREKRLKRWNRLWKMNLIESNNREWVDLSESIGVTADMLLNACSGKS